VHLAHRTVERTGPSFSRLKLALLAAAVVAATALGCDDPFAPRADTPVRTDTFTVFAMSGTPASVPSAFHVIFFTPVRVDATFGFHFAFDLDSAGRVKVIPVRLVGGPATANRRVGLQKATVAFDEVTRAPLRGYVYDSVLTLQERETAIVEVLADLCTFSTLSQLVYAKLEILAVDPLRRLIGFRIAYDPNCGFRSFLPGVPKD
jgi:hypothetical protein